MNFSYKDKILISTPDVSGDIFSRSVVLMIAHDENGAFGLILNKKNERLSRYFRNFFGFNTDIYEGGPVETGKIFLIVKGNPEAVTEFYTKINKDFYLTEDLENVTKAVLENKLNLQNIKVFSGYSGWSAHQLENEIYRKMWTIVDVYNLDYTLPNNQNLWKNIMQNLGGEFLLWANAPEDVSFN
ncbi:MAG: YqgE/AlgH family protein [Flavobacteriaceae bacterium]|jgi:putative transcriptional regulator|nr:YqgE/AlgH family protein [Flavobacteriaceae bacterium]